LTENRDNAHTYAVGEIHHTTVAALVVAEGEAMTLAQARKRFPNVPAEIVKWAVENIRDPRDLERGLNRLEQSKRVQARYAS
jgi:hypothetical protein